MFRTKLISFAAFALAVAPGLPAATAAKMYWVDVFGSQLKRAELDGTTVENLSVTTFSIGIALDLEAGRMYWTQFSAFPIMRADLDGFNLASVSVPELDSPVGIALDLAAGKLYWTDIGTETIRRANLDGSEPEDLLTGLIEPEAVALDVESGRLYWADKTANGFSRISRANLDGTNAQTIVVLAEGKSGGLALDLEAGRIYWTAPFDDKIRRSTLHGTMVEEVLTGLDRPTGIALDVAAGKMYWTQAGQKHPCIRRANLDGSEIEDLVTSGVVSPWGIALDLRPPGPLPPDDPTAPTLSQWGLVVMTLLLMTAGTLIVERGRAAA